MTRLSGYCLHRLSDNGLSSKTLSHMAAKIMLEMIHSVLLGHNLLYLILLSLVSNLSCNSWHFCCHLMSQKHQLVVKSPELQKDSWEHFVLKCLMVTVTGVINIVVVSSQRNKALILTVKFCCRPVIPSPSGWQSMASSFCQASLPGCALTQSQIVWALSGICCCRPSCLELTERWSALSDA